MYFGNEYLHDALYEQTVLNEMHISKKDLNDPKILDKVLEKSKKESDNAQSLALSVPFLLGVAADVVLGIATGSILVSLVAFMPFIIGSALLALKLFFNLPNYEEKNIKKLVDKVEKLKNNALKLKDGKEKQEIIDKCDKILKLVNKYETKKLNKAEKEKYEKDKKYINYLINVSGGKEVIDAEYMARVYRDYYYCNLLGIIKPAELDKVVVNYCMKHANDKNGYGSIMELFCGEDTLEDAIKILGDKDVNDLEKVIPGFKNNQKMFIFYAIDDTISFFNPKNKKFYFGDYGADSLTYDSSLYKLSEKLGKRYATSEDYISKEETERLKAVYEEIKKK